MRVLLDTCTFLWLDSEPENLHPHIRQLLDAPETTPVLSVVSVWELIIKSRTGKLPLRASVDQIISGYLKNKSFTLLPVTLEHVMAVDGLPSFHRDPFDRLLVAQAIVEGIPLVSKDSMIDRYPITRIWT